MKYDYVFAGKKKKEEEDCKHVTGGGAEEQATEGTRAISSMMHLQSSHYQTMNRAQGVYSKSRVSGKVLEVEECHSPALQRGGHGLNLEIRWVLFSSLGIFF